MMRVTLYDVRISIIKSSIYVYKLKLNFAKASPNPFTILYPGSHGTSSRCKRLDRLATAS